jgi:hypothetical protein
MTSNSAREEAKDTTVDQLAEALLRIGLPEHNLLLKKLPPLVDSIPHERKEIAAQLAVIGRNQPFSVEDLLLRLHSSLNGLDRTLVNCVLFMERAAQQWEKISPLDGFVKSAFLRRRYVFAALLLDQPEFVLNGEHPMAQLLSRVESLFMGWEEAKGQPPAFIMKALAALTRLLDADHCLDLQEQQAALTVLSSEWEREKKRRELLEKRLIDSELGLDQARYHQWLCTRVVNRFTGNFPLPLEVIRFIQGPWLDSALLVLNEKGELHPQFMEMTRLTEQLVFAFKPMRSEDDYNKLYNFAVALVDNLARNLLSLVHAPIELQMQLDKVEDLLMAVVKRTDDLVREVATPVVMELTINDTPIEDAAVRELIGQWFRRSGRICKILTYLPRQKKVLWGDFTGRKAGLEDAVQILSDAASGSLQPFNENTCMHGVFAAVAKAFISLDKLERIKYRDRLHKEKAVRDAAREKAEAEALAIRAARVETEARIAREQQEAEEKLREHQLAQAERDKIERLRAAREAIDGLKLGDPVTIVRDSGPVAATLAVRLNAAQKLIFTNGIGLTIAELHRDDAVALFLEEKILPGDKAGHNEAWRARFMGRMGVGRK